MKRLRIRKDSRNIVEKSLHVLLRLHESYNVITLYYKCNNIVMTL